jgi:hypothetical protein
MVSCSTAWPLDARRMGIQRGIRMAIPYPPAVSPWRFPKNIGRSTIWSNCSFAFTTPTRPPASPSGSQSFHLSAGFIFQRFSVPSQIAPHHHGFQPDGCRRFIGGIVEMEQILSGSDWLRVVCFRQLRTWQCTRCGRQWANCGPRRNAANWVPLPYSITSVARSRMDGGTARPSVLAVLRFTAISNLVGNCTGRSPGFSPRRMRST